MTVLNGCDIRRFNKRSLKCWKCTNKGYCARKKEEPISTDKPLSDEIRRLQRVARLDRVEAMLLAEAMGKKFVEVGK